MWKAKTPSNQRTIRTAAIIPNMSLTPFTSEREPTEIPFGARGTDSDLLVEFVLASQAWQSGDLKSVRYESHPQNKLERVQRTIWRDERDATI
jgi:hypothetical protein